MTLILLELGMHTRLAWNSKRTACFCLLSIVIKGVGCNCLANKTTLMTQSSTQASSYILKHIINKLTLTTSQCYVLEVIYLMTQTSNSIAFHALFFFTLASLLDELLALWWLWN